MLARFAGAAKAQWVIRLPDERRACRRSSNRHINMLDRYASILLKPVTRCELRSLLGPTARVDEDA